MLYGAPTHRVEFHLMAVSEVLGLESSFFMLPGMMMISFGGDDSSSSTHLIRTSNGYDMGKLSSVNKLCHNLAEKKVGIEDAVNRLEAIRQQSRMPGILGHPILNTTWFYYVAFPLHAFCICIIGFGGKAFEALIAAGLAFVTANLVLMAERYLALGLRSAILNIYA